MGLGAKHSMPGRAVGRFARVTSVSPLASTHAVVMLDDDSYEPLASMAHEIGRELGGDGMLVTWHEEEAEPRHLFADGACETNSAIAHDIAAMGEIVARAQGAGAKSYWRTLTDDSSAGVLTTSIPSDRGVLTIATFFRRVGRSTRMTAGETAARLLPLVQPFFRTWLSRLRTVATVKALTAVLDDSDVGMLLLDRSGHIVLSNTAASALLDRGDGIRRRGTTVAGSSMADTLRLHAAIDRAVALQSASRSRPNQSMVSLKRAKAAPLMAAVVANAEASGDSADCAAIIYIVDPDQDLQLLIEPVCALFGLSPAETRLACLLVRGCSLADAATRLGIREQTARSYLKQVFLKTEVNRQAELVRVLLLSAVRVGHGTPSRGEHP